MSLRVAYPGRADEGRPASAPFADRGPMFSALGLYLSTRVDLLPGHECLALAEIPDHAPPLAGVEVWQLIGRELKRDPGELFSTFETVACESRVLFQVHHARLKNGQAVTVRVRKADEEAAFGPEAAWRLPLESALGGRARGFPLEAVMADFRRHWRHRCDFLGAAEAMGEYARQTASCPWLRTPRIHRELCTPRVLVVERVAGVTLEEILGPRGRQGAEAGAAPAVAAATGMDPRQLARQLCGVWLELALAGRFFPATPRASEVVLLPNQQFAFAGMNVATLPEDARTNLGDYLTAASTHDSDRACGHLLRETERERRGDHEEELRRRLRQAIPFRDGGWVGREGGETLAEQVALHCRLAHEQGYRLRPDSLEFLGSLCLVSGAAQALAPGSDPLLEALEDLRLRSAVAAFQALLGLGQMRENADRYASAFMELPKKLDQALTRAAAGGPGSRAGGPVAPARPPGRSALVGVALALGLVAVVALSRQLAAMAGGKWAEELGALLFVVVSALLLRAVTVSE